MRWLHEKLASLNHFTTETALDLDPELHTLATRFHEIYKYYETTPERKNMRNALRAQAAAIADVRHDICFGLGSFWTAFEAKRAMEADVILLQLCVMLDRVLFVNKELKGLRKVNMYAQDPKFTTQDVRFLRYLHFAVSTGETDYQSKVDKHAIFYAPHLEQNFDMRPIAGGASKPPIMITDLGIHGDEQLVQDIGKEATRVYVAVHRAPIQGNYRAVPVWAWQSKSPVPSDVRWHALQDICLWVRK